MIPPEREKKDSKESRSEQGRPELLLAAGAVVWLGGEMSRRCSGYRIIQL